jgi:peptidoglycan/xylan/chitin deacetylase (PgdA/CDA1 family)
VKAAGMTVGSHTWSHKDLSTLPPEEAKAEIEKGIAAVSIALGSKSIDPFFRFPALKHPPDMVKYLGTRNIGIFSCDFDSFDFKMHHPSQVVRSVMHKLEKHHKGIILMHDFQRATAEALPELLKELKEGGYKVVQIVGKTPVEPLPEYKQIVLKEIGGGLATARPMSSVIKTISGPTN